MNKHSLVIALGTNDAQSHNMAAAKKLLSEALGKVKFTRSMWTLPIGQPSPLYLNALATAQTNLGSNELVGVLKDIERSLGRTPEARAAHKVSIDLDLLQYDNTRFHTEDWERNYVKELINELDGTE